MNKFWRKMVTMDFLKAKRLSKKAQMTHIMTMQEYDMIQIENVGQGHFWFYFNGEKEIQLLRLKNIKNIKVEYYGELNDEN